MRCRRLDSASVQLLLADVTEVVDAKLPRRPGGCGGFGVVRLKGLMVVVVVVVVREVCRYRWCDWNWDCGGSGTCCEAGVVLVVLGA